MNNYMVLCFFAFSLFSKHPCLSNCFKLSFSMKYKGNLTILNLRFAHLLIDEIYLESLQSFKIRH